jgi:hypothetical protein
VNAIRKHLKLIAPFLIVTFLLQSCSVHTNKTTTVDEAVKIGFAYKTKVKTQNNRRYVFAKIEKENQQIFGLRKRNTGFDKIYLEQNQIKEIYSKSKNETLSIVVPMLNVGADWCIL